MQRTAVINVVGLTERLLGRHTPKLNAFRQSGVTHTIIPALPAVTCTAQSTYLTGTTATHHGIVGNGWYHRELAEVQFWKQSNHLVHGRKLWEGLRQHDPRFTCAKLFWWYNMYSSADYSITPRPMYPADGRKVFDIYTWPFSIRTEIKAELGEFPFPTFWGPAAGVRTPQGPPDAASRWIAQSARWIEQRYQPTLSLVYLPHLDYNLQRFGPSDAGNSSGLNSKITPDIEAIDAIVGDLVDFYRQRSVQVAVVSEYGITPVSRPVHLNRVFRQKGWLTVKDELGRELLDAGASKVFAVADHQVAHVYIHDASLKSEVRSVLEQTAGVGAVLGAEEKKSTGLDHARAGDLIAMSAPDSWFTYYYWLDDAVAPDFARTVDIHRKPGYDPVELFLDPGIKFPKLKIAGRLAKKKLGFRMLMDVVPLDASLVKGSHGARPADTSDYPLLISPERIASETQIEAPMVYEILRKLVLG